MNLLSFSVTSLMIFHVEKQLTKKTRYFVTLSDFQFSTYVPIQLIPVDVERTNEHPVKVNVDQLTPVSPTFSESIFPPQCSSTMTLKC